MREFMTKMSDFLNEKWNNPERKEDRLAIVIIGVAAAIVVVLLLLLLWGCIAGERRQREAESAESGMLAATTYKEDAAEYMSQNIGQEYDASIEYLNDKIEELLTALTQVEQNLSKNVEQYQNEDSAIKEQITSLRTEVNTIMRELKETQTKLYDLIDIVQVMNEETLAIIQEQIKGIQTDLDQVHADINNLYTRMLQYRYDPDKNTLYLEPYTE